MGTDARAINEFFQHFKDGAEQGKRILVIFNEHYGSSYTLDELEKELKEDPSSGLQHLIDHKELLLTIIEREIRFYLPALY